MKGGVIGAGTMGSGIAQAFAQTEGYEVMLCDINEEFAANGKKKIEKTLSKRVAKGRPSKSLMRSASRRVFLQPIPPPSPSRRSAQALTATWLACISSIRLLL